MEAQLLQYGVAGAAMALAFAMLKVLEKAWDKRTSNGNGKIECPNKIHDLAAVLRNLDSTIKRSARIEEEVKAGVATLVDQHKPVDGIEQWKIGPELRETFRDISRNGERAAGLLDELVKITKNGTK